MTSYRPYRQPQVSVPGVTRRPDPIVDAAASIILSPVLPPAPVVQVPWSAKALRAFAACMFAISIICLFALGGILVARLFEGPVVVLALLAYAIGFGVLCRKLRL